MLDDASSPRLVFASTSLGTLLQISYRTRNVLCVLRLHSEPILSLCVNEGYCVIGCAEGILRLWPLDFADYLLEARHEDAVTSVALSLDGLTLLVGTERGTIGKLDVVTQKYAPRERAKASTPPPLTHQSNPTFGPARYTTVARSHTGRILRAARDPASLSAATIGEDLTVRVWDLTTGQQTKEFLSPHDSPTSLCYPPGDEPATSLCVGFQSGFVRVFSLPTISTLFELEQHTGPVLSLLYVRREEWRARAAASTEKFECARQQRALAKGCVTHLSRARSLRSLLPSLTAPTHSFRYGPTGETLYSAATDGHISVFDVTQDYLPVKTVACDVPATCVKLRLDPTGQFLAAPGPEEHVVTV
jgi:WD40 repeat protein